jgi:hypothetical protein
MFYSFFKGWLHQKVYPRAKSAKAQFSTFKNIFAFNMWLIIFHVPFFTLCFHCFFFADIFFFCEWNLFHFEFAKRNMRKIWKSLHCDDDDDENYAKVHYIFSSQHQFSAQYQESSWILSFFLYIVSS